MTIDINELRRLAQAATLGPWYATGKLTRYVEARIDGGLIQEVAACGPTKADGGYGPQQEANARLIAAANPAAITELLDRLEAAERDRATFVREIGNLCTKVEALREELSKQQSLSQAAQQLAEVAQRRADALRAKIERMEQQEPVAEWIENKFDQYPQLIWDEKYKAVVGTKLYALPGAKGE